ncbi:kinase-like domain-containing protein, partial [Haematococcus lacustris]
LGQRLGSVIGGEGQQAGGSLSGRASQGGGLGGAATHLVVPHNAWEWREQYDEKVDIWQVGCLVHELLCGCLPFETEDKLLSSALILWADLVALPDSLSPQCMAFMQACLIKDPAQRPSASQLLQHEWLVRLGAGETLPSCRQLQEAADPSLVPHSLADILRQARQGAGGGSQRGWRPLSAWLAGLGGWLWGGGRGG